MCVSMVSCLSLTTVCRFSQAGPGRWNLVLGSVTLIGNIMFVRIEITIDNIAFPVNIFPRGNLC